MLVGQAIIVTLLSSLFLFMPSVNGSYWLLTALVAQLYMLMYLLMFFAAVKLRFSAPNHYRAFRIPGGTFGMIAVVIIGMVGACTTLVVSFFPPEGIKIGSISQYEIMLVSGLFLMCLPPFIFNRLQSRRTSIGDMAIEA